MMRRYRSFEALADKNTVIHSEQTDEAGSNSQLRLNFEIFSFSLSQKKK
jgi:hypothetical protein